MQPYNYQHQNQEGYRFVDVSSQMQSFVYSPYNTNTNVPFASPYKEVPLLQPPSVYHRVPVQYQQSYPELPSRGSNLQYIPTTVHDQQFQQQLNSQTFSTLSANSQQTRLSPDCPLIPKKYPIMIRSLPLQHSSLLEHSSSLQCVSPLKSPLPVKHSSPVQCFASTLHHSPTQQLESAIIYHPQGPRQNMEQSGISDVTITQGLLLGVTEEPDVSSCEDYYSNMPQPPFHTELKDQCSGDMNDSSAHTKVWKEMLRGCVIDSNGIQTTELDSSTFLPLERRESNVPIQCLSNHNSINSSDDFEYQLTSLLQQIPKLPESSESSPHSTCHRSEDCVDIERSTSHTSLKRSCEPEMTNNEASKEFIERAAIHGISIINPKELKTNSVTSTRKTAELNAEIFVEKAVNCGITVGKCEDQTEKYCAGETDSKQSRTSSLDEMVDILVIEVIDKVVLQLINEQNSLVEGSEQIGENINSVKLYILNPNMPAFEPHFSDSIQSGQLEENNTNKKDNPDCQSIDSTVPCTSSHIFNPEAETFVFKFTASSPSNEQDRVTKAETKHNCSTGSNSPLVLSPNLLNEEFKLNENNSGKVFSSLWKPDELDTEVEKSTNKLHFAAQCMNAVLNPLRRKGMPCKFMSKCSFSNSNSLFPDHNDSSRSSSVMAPAVPVVSRHVQTDVKYIEEKVRTSRDCLGCEEKTQRLLNVEVLVVKLRSQIYQMELERLLHELTYTAHQRKQFFVSVNQDEHISQPLDSKIQYLKDEIKRMQQKQEDCVTALISGQHLESIPVLTVGIPSSTGSFSLQLKEDGQTDKTPDKTCKTVETPSTSKQNTWATWQTAVPASDAESKKLSSCSEVGKKRGHSLQISSSCPNLKLGKRTYSTDDLEETSVKKVITSDSKQVFTGAHQYTHDSEKVEKHSSGLNTLSKQNAVPESKKLRAGSTTNYGDGEIMEGKKQKDTTMDLSRILEAEWFQALQQHSYQWKMDNSLSLIGGSKGDQLSRDNREETLKQAMSAKQEESIKKPVTLVQHFDSSFTNLKSSTSEKLFKSVRKHNKRPIDNSTSSASSRKSSVFGNMTQSSLSESVEKPNDDSRLESGDLLAKVVDSTSSTNHSVSKRMELVKSQNISLKPSVNWYAYAKSINSKESASRSDFVARHAHDSMYLKLIDDVTDVPTEYSFKESVCSTELDGYPDIDLDQLVRQAKNVLHKYTTDKTEAGPSVTNNKEKPDSRTVYKESNQVKHKYKDDIKTSAADLALSGNDIASAKTPMEVDVVNKRTIDVKHVIADAVKMSVVDKTSTEVKNSKTVSKEVVINKNNTSNEACTMNDAVSRKDTKELCGELTKDKLTQPSNIPQTHPEDKTTVTMNVTSEPVLAHVDSDISMSDDTLDRACECGPQFAYPGNSSQAIPAVLCSTSATSFPPAPDSTPSLLEKTAYSLVPAIASVTPTVSSSTSDNSSPPPLDSATSSSGSIANVFIPTVASGTSTVSSSSSDYSSLPALDSTPTLFEKTAYASVPAIASDTHTVSSSTSDNSSSSTLDSATSSSGSIANIFIPAVTSVTQTLSSSTSVKASAPEPDSTTYVISTAASVTQSVSSTVVLSASSELSTVSSSELGSMSLGNSSSADMSNQTLGIAVDSQVNANAPSSKSSSSETSRVSTGQSNSQTVVSDHSSPTGAVNSQTGMCDLSSVGSSSNSLTDTFSPSEGSLSYSELNPHADGTGANAHACIDPVLFQAVMTQLTQAYPQMAANPQLLQAVCMQQTVVLQSYMHNSQTLVNPGTIPVKQSTIPESYSPLPASDGMLQATTVSNESDKIVDACTDIGRKDNQRTSAERESKIHCASETNLQKISVNLKHNIHNVDKSNDISGIKSNSDTRCDQSIIGENKRVNKKSTFVSHTGKSDKIKKAHAESDPVLTFDPSLISNDCSTQISKADSIADSNKERKATDATFHSPTKNTFDSCLKSVTPLRKTDGVATAPGSKPSVETISADLTPKWFDTIQPLRRPGVLQQPELTEAKEDDLPDSLKPYALHKRKKSGQEASRPLSKPSFSAVVNASETAVSSTTAAAAAADPFKSKLTKLVKTGPKENTSAPSTFKSGPSNQATGWNISSTKTSDENWNLECDPFPKEFKCVFDPKRPVDLTKSCPKPLKPLAAFSKKKTIPKVNSSGKCVNDSLIGISSIGSDPFASKEGIRMNKQFLSSLLEANNKSNESKLKKQNDKNKEISTKSEASECEDCEAVDVTDSEGGGGGETWQKVSKKKKREHREPPKMNQQPLPTAKPEVKKSNYEKLVLLLQSKFPHLDRSDAIDVILKIRSERGVLSGLTVNTIVEMTMRIINSKQAACQPASTPAADPTLSKVGSVKSADEEGEVCAICCDELVTGEVNVLDCGHQFHLACIRQWLLGHERTCPTCRRIALLPDEFPKLAK